MNFIKNYFRRLRYIFDKRAYKLTAVTVKFNLENSCMNTVSSYSRKIFVNEPLKYIHDDETFSKIGSWNAGKQFLKDKGEDIKKIAIKFYEIQKNNKMIVNEFSEYNPEIIKGYSFELDDVENEMLEFEEWEKWKYQTK